MPRSKTGESAYESDRRARQQSAMFDDCGRPRDVFSEFFAFAKVSRGDFTATLSFTSPGSAGWSPALCDELLVLTRANMQALYDGAGARAPSWAWDDAGKRAELADADARYVVVRDATTDALLGFVHFRFVLEDTYDALYVYELQLAQASQRQGLGKHLMVVCELIAKKQGMHWCVWKTKSRSSLCVS
jgi:GNAT superfamily N-acetyltransferase